MVKVHEIAIILIFPRWFCKDIILVNFSLIIGFQIINYELTLISNT
jgi:hypothetical protein